MAPVIVRSLLGYGRDSFLRELRFDFIRRPCWSVPTRRAFSLLAAEARTC